MPLYRTKRSPFHYYDFYIGNSRYRGSTKEKGVNKARQFEADLIVKLTAGEDPSPRKRVPTLLEFAPAFLKFNSDSRKRDASKDYYRNGWRLLSALPITHLRLNQITRSSADTINPPGSGSTVNCAIRTLRRMLSLAEERGIIISAPKLSLVEEVKRDRLVTPEEEALILFKANPTVHDLYLMMMDLGTRPSEAVSVPWTDVDFPQRTVFISRGKTKKARRMLSMTTRVYEMLLKRAALDPMWLFPAPRREGHIKPRSAIAMASQLKKKLGLPADLVLYSARHTFGTDYQAACKDLTKTSRQLGHSATSITERYVHPVADSTAVLMDQRNQLRAIGHPYRQTCLETLQ